MLAIKAAKAQKRGIPCKIFKSLIKLYFYCFIFYGFPLISFLKSKVRYMFM